MKKIIAILVIFALLSMTFFSGLAMAMEFEDAKDFNPPQDAEITDHGEVDFDWLYWIKSIFSVGEFSIVGSQRRCDDEPREIETMEMGKGVKAKDVIEDVCSSGNGLLNIFEIDGSWNPIIEVSDEHNPYVAFQDFGGTVGGKLTLTSYRRYDTYNLDGDEVGFQIYCCPHEECDRDSDCEDWVGPGTECIEEDYDDPHIDYYEDEYSKCTTDVEITCWFSFEGDNNCQSRPYADKTECPDEFMERKLYEDKDECEDNIVQPPECQNGETKCDGEFYLVCENDEWKDKGKVDGKCNYEATCEELEADGEGCKERNDCVFAKDNRCKDLNSIDCHNIMYEEGCSKDSDCEWENNACQEIKVCKTFADKNCDGIVSITEIEAEIDNWLKDNLSRTKLGEAIEAWSN